MKNTLIIKNIVLYYQSCGVKVSKNKIERLSGVGVWPVNPSNDRAESTSPTPGEGVFYPQFYRHHSSQRIPSHAA